MIHRHSLNPNQSQRTVVTGQRQPNNDIDMSQVLKTGKKRQIEVGWGGLLLLGPDPDTNAMQRLNPLQRGKARYHERSYDKRIRNTKALGKCSQDPRPVPSSATLPRLCD